jgi:hypothetical protein
VICLLHAIVVVLSIKRQQFKIQLPNMTDKKFTAETKEDFEAWVKIIRANTQSTKNRQKPKQ